MTYDPELASNSDWLTPNEAMTQFKFSRNWLRTLRLTGAVEARETRWCWLFNRASLERYIQIRSTRAAKHIAKGE